MSAGSAIARAAAAGLVVLWLAGGGRTNCWRSSWRASRSAPQWILANYLRGGLLALTAPLHKALLLAAMAAQAWRLGARRGITNWPLLAVGYLAVQSLLLADLQPRLTLPVMAFAALDLALPWTLVHLVVAPGSRARYAALLASLALGCVASGVALHLIRSTKRTSSPRAAASGCRAPTTPGGSPASPSPALRSRARLCARPGSWPPRTMR